MELVGNWVPDRKGHHVFTPQRPAEGDTVMVVRSDLSPKRVQHYTFVGESRLLSGGDYGYGKHHTECWMTKVSWVYFKTDQFIPDDWRRSGTWWCRAATGIPGRNRVPRGLERQG